VDIAEYVQISQHAFIDKNINSSGVHIQKFTRIVRGVKILSHDACRHLKSDVTTGKNCFIGLNTIILPGVTIGNEVVIGSGAVVSKDIPCHSIAVGNPAKVIRKNVRCGRFEDILNKEDCVEDCT